MRRIGLAVVLALSLVLVPLVSEAQQAEKLRQVGVLNVGGFTPPPGGPDLAALTANLRSLGWVEGQNYTIVRRYTDGRDDRLPDLAAELVRLKVDLIVAVSTKCALAARQATATIPIVMVQVADPVQSGLVTSLAHPGGNVTGITFMGLVGQSIGRVTAGKELQLLREIAPRVSRLAYLWDLTNPNQVFLRGKVDAPALALGIKVWHIGVQSDSDLDNAMRLVLKERVEAVDFYGSSLVSPPATQRFAEFAVKNRVLTISAFPIFTRMRMGFLMSWGPSFSEQWQRAAHYVDRILKGAKPADLPVEQPTKFELVINLKTAKAMGLTIPQTLLLQADQVIE
jgi:putative ABC transport system substrate-binding protein